MDWGTLGQTAAQFLIDYFAVVVGAVCGALFAVERKLDIVGTVTLGLIAGYGGGIIRDLLLPEPFEEAGAVVHANHVGGGEIIVARDDGVRQAAPYSCTFMASASGTRRMRRMCSSATAA